MYGFLMEMNRKGDIHMGENKLRHGLLILLMALLAGLSASGLIEKTADVLGAGRAGEQTRAYIDTSFDTSMKGFLILSAIKSGLAVIEGSEVGVGFNLQVGDVVQSVYDYVDIAWKTALMGGTVLLLTQMLLQVVALVNHWCLALVFLIILFMQLRTFFSNNQAEPSPLVRQLFSMATILTVCLYVILPLSIRGAAWLSSKITNPLMTEAREGFSSVKEDLSVETLSKKLFGEGQGDTSWADRLNLSAQYAKATNHLKQLGDDMSKKAEEIAVWTVKLIAGYLFDCLIFPITFFFLLYMFTRFSFQYLLTLSLSGPRERIIVQP